MLNQVTRALSALFRPIASHQSSEDRDPTGQGYEKQEKPKPDHPENPSAKTEATSPAPAAQIIQITSAQAPTSEDEQERRKRAIANSQAWVGLVTELEERKAEAGGEQAKANGAGVYEKANTGASRAARAKKGVILDKKAA